MHQHLDAFKAQVKAAPTDPQAERRVRLMLEETAKVCPMDYLLRLAQVVIDRATEENKDEVSSN